jgi:N-acetylglutamate synthase-like GNAT family acetyltransferase
LTVHPPAPSSSEPQGAAILAAWSGLDAPAIVIRTARAGEASRIHALVQDHLEEGRLLPRQLGELERRLPRFVVAAAGDRVRACAELAPLSRAVAEVRSLVVHREVRDQGLGRRLVHALTRRARVEGYDTLCAFTHGAGYFVRLGFTIVPHHWVREKIVADCQACPLFRTCGQHAVVLPLDDRARGSRRAHA